MSHCPLHNNHFRIHITENYDAMVSRIQGLSNQMKFIRGSVRITF